MKNTIDSHEETEALVNELNMINGGMLILRGQWSVATIKIGQRIAEYKTACGLDSESEAIKVAWLKLADNLTIGDQALLLQRIHRSGITIREFFVHLCESESIVETLKALESRPKEGEALCPISHN